MSFVFYRKYAQFSVISFSPLCAWVPFHFLGDEVRALPSFYKRTASPGVPVQWEPAGPCVPHVCPLCLGQPAPAGPPGLCTLCVCSWRHFLCALEGTLASTQSDVGVGGTRKTSVPRSQWTGVLISCPGGPGPVC